MSDCLLSVVENGSSVDIPKTFPQMLTCTVVLWKCADIVDAEKPVIGDHGGNRMMV